MKSMVFSDLLIKCYAVDLPNDVSKHHNADGLCQNCEKQCRYKVESLASLLFVAGIVENVADKVEPKRRQV